ncbi:unnamed protein product [Symbiodinium necroappetens]|uniref:Uncharacterized protein n=1 Tax=Symbiodinium necroappetens TaxID=1628268 RepID=A0A812QTB6_9DINO|nr:unnamed protein product [Symbiodinium necroappetens]
MQDVPVATIQTLRLLRSVDARVWRLGEELCDVRVLVQGHTPRRRRGNRRNRSFGRLLVVARPTARLLDALTSRMFCADVRRIPNAQCP